MVSGPCRSRNLMKTSSRTIHLSSLRRWAKSCLVCGSFAWNSNNSLGALPSIFDWPARMNTFTTSSAACTVVPRKNSIKQVKQKRYIFAPFRCRIRKNSAFVSAEFLRVPLLLQLHQLIRREAHLRQLPLAVRQDHLHVHLLRLPQAEVGIGRLAGSIAVACGNLSATQEC